MLVHIVDDNAINCEIFAATAARLGSDIRVVSFVDPVAAYEACRTLLPDLIVVDFMMPGMDGHEYTARVRALPGAKAVPIVMITAAADRAIRHKALELGATDFLTKPVDKQEMRARLNNLLALRRAHLSLQDRSRWLAEEVRKATEQVLHQANHDGLTGLPNRTFFRDKLEQILGQAARSGRQVAVLYLDLDGFKEVNDAIGHAGGDQVLQDVASSLREVLREGEMAARLGGDEFALIQTDVPQPREAAGLAERATEAIAGSHLRRGVQAKVGVSIGVALCPEDGISIDQLMQNADLALYRAKRAGKGGIRFFEPGMDAQLRVRQALERDLRAAMSAAALDVHYQPQADATTGAIVGFEALLRWSHPDRGMVPPAQFVPLAEECGLIQELGEWVLRTACAQAATWPANIRLGVNLSPLQVRADLPRLVQNILVETGLPAKRLELEITEGVLIKDSTHAIVILSDLKSQGISIALDDFGTGYSSLSYLQKFPFDRLKIDRSFVEEVLTLPEAAAIIRAIVAMAQSLSIASIAEGVETIDQLRAMQRESCQEIQGYLIGRAMSGRDVPQFLADWRMPDERAAAA